MTEKTDAYGKLVQGHAGKLLFGFLGAKTPVVLMVGRLQSVSLYSLLDLRLHREALLTGSKLL